MAVQAAFMDAFKQALADGIKDGHDEAKLLSSGTASYRQLAEEDHPYALRHGFPLRPVEIINMHRGAFFDAWITSPVQESGTTLSASIENHSLTARGNDLSDYLTQPRGNPKTKMFQRPIDKEVEAKTEEQLYVRIAERLADFDKLVFIL